MSTDSAGERLVEGLSGAMTISWPERGEREDYGDDGWGGSDHGSRNVDLGPLLKSVSKWLVKIVVYLLVFSASLIVWAIEIKAWAIWDASLPIASNLFAALHSIGLTLALLVLTYDSISIFLFIVLATVLSTAMLIWVASVLYE